MPIPGLDKIIDTVGDTIVSLTGDKRKDQEIRQTLAEAKAKLVEAQAGVDKSQLELVKEDAKSEDWTRWGWRMMIYWSLALSFAWTMFLVPVLQVVLPMMGVMVPIVHFPSEVLLTMTFGALGLGSLRTIEKMKLPK